MYEYLPSPNQSSRKGHQVGGIIAHFTAGGSVGGTARYMCNKIRVPKSLQGRTGKGFVVYDDITYYNARAAAHYITGRPDEERKVRTIRLVSENRSAWHAGSATTKPKLNDKGSLNLWTLGHEICNWGGLRKEGDRFYCWPNNWTKEYTGPDPVYVSRVVGTVAEGYIRADGSPAFPNNLIEWWEPYQSETIEAVITLWKEIVGRYDITREWIVGHEDVDPTRKIDPGPAFPWEKVLDAVFPKKKKEKSDLLYAEEPSEDITSGELGVEVATAEKYLEDDRSITKQGIYGSLLNMFFE